MGLFNSEYVVYFDWASLIIMTILLLAYHTIKHLNTVANRLLQLMIYSHFIVVVMDLVNGLGPNHPLTANARLLYLSHLVYYLMHSLTVFAFFCYCCFMVDWYGKGKRWIQVLLVLPQMLVFLLVLTNVWTGWVFAIRDNLQYERGPMVLILYAVGAWYVLLSLVVITVCRRKITKFQFGVTYLYLFFCILGVLIQYIYPTMLVESFGITVALLVIFFVTAKFTELYDDTYEVLNARAFHEMIYGSLHWVQRFHIVVIKIHELPLYRLAMGKEFQENLIREMIRYTSDGYPSFDVFHYTTSTIVMKTRKAMSQEEVENVVRELSRRYEDTWKIGDIEIRCSCHLAMFVCGENEEVHSAMQLKECLDYLIDYSKTIEKKVLGIEDMRIGAVARSLLVQRLLKDAVENDGFEMYYQPIYSVKEKRIISAEALIRLKSTEYGFISPEEFIPVAEQNGLIMRIGEFVFRAVCSFVKDYNLEQLGIQFIEVNLSVVQCMQEKLGKQLMDIVNEYGLVPEQINLEITETAEVVRFDAFQKNVVALHDKGFPFSLDDYGTGYSNIGFLYKFPFRFIKIDKSLLWSAFENEKAMITFVSSIELVKRLQLEVVIEGVETAEQVDKLIQLECEYLQGYYFSKPLPPDAFLQYLEEFPKEDVNIR